MNSVANADLLDNPAFTRVRQVVEAGGNGNELYMVTNAPAGSSEEALQALANSINDTSYSAAYAIIVEP